MRCPNCGGLNPDGATWCGQCFTRFDSSVAEPQVVVRETAAPAFGSDPNAPKASGWTCPVCRTVNPLTADSCTNCSTPMFQALRSASGRDVGQKGSPEIAAALSVIPGAGHLYLKRGAEAATRLVLAIWWLGTALVIPGEVPASGMVRVLFILAFVALAGLSMFDAFRQASEPQATAILSARLLLYWSLGMLGLLAAGLSIGTLGAAAR